MALNPVSIAAAMVLNVNKQSDFVRRYVAPQCDVSGRFSIKSTSSNTATGRYLKRMPQNAQGIEPNTNVIQAGITQQAAIIGLSWEEVDHSIDRWSVQIPLGETAVLDGDAIGVADIEREAAQTLSDNNQVWLEERTYAAMNGSWSTSKTGASWGYINDLNFNFSQKIRDLAFEVKRAANGAYPNTLVVADDVLTYISQNPSFLNQFGASPFAGGPQATRDMLAQMFAANGATALPFQVVVARAVHQTSNDNAASTTVTNGAIVPSGFAWLGYVAADDNGAIMEACALRDNSAMKTIVAKDYSVKVYELPGTAGTIAVNAWCNKDVVITNAGAGAKITGWISS